MTDLDLHPAAEVVPEEVGGDGVEHVHLVRLERHRLLVKVVPSAPESTSLVPYLLQLRVVLDYDGVLDVGALRRLLRVSLGPRGRHSTALKGDIKGGLKKLRLESKTYIFLNT